MTQGSGYRRTPCQWLHYADHEMDPLRRSHRGSITPVTNWILYADHGMDPIWRSVTQPHEQKEVIAKKREDTQRQGAGPHAPELRLLQDVGPGQHAAGAQGDAGQQEGRYVFQRYTQRGERGPQANGGKRVQIGFHGSILDVRVFARRSEPEGLLGIFENLNAPAVSRQVVQVKVQSPHTSLYSSLHIT